MNIFYSYIAHKYTPRRNYSIHFKTNRIKKTIFTPVVSFQINELAKVQHVFCACSCTSVFRRSVGVKSTVLRLWSPLFEFIYSNYPSTSPFVSTVTSR